MTDLLKIKECEGYNPTEAFANLGFDPNNSLVQNPNVTTAWKRAGRPFPGTLKFKKFAIKQLNKKTRRTPGYGLYVVLDPPQEDTRLLPFKVINPKVEGKRNWTRVFFIREDEINVKEEDGEQIVDIVTEGNIITECYSKAEAIETMKQLTTMNHKSYSAMAVKVPDRDKLAAMCIYTPSVTAKKGKYVAFGINANV